MSQVGIGVEARIDIGNVLTKIVIGTGTLIVALILGSYTYTWSESGRQDEEKAKWREQHEKTLDIRFAEVKEGQRQLTEAVNKSNDKTTEILMQILTEQRKANDVIKRRNQ